MSENSGLVLGSEKLPRHVAFIMDGNGRWAARQNLPRLKGHAAGIEAVRNVIENLSELGVPVATFYTFSTENWGRPLEEVTGIFDLMRWWFRKELAETIKRGVRILFIGNRTDGRLAPDILKLMAEVEEKTAHNTKITALFAINYSGRDELLRATQSLLVAQEHNRDIPITPETLAAQLDTAGLPDPDLIIRTSGEQRVSNFLLWQLAYSEFWFTPRHWPDFDRETLHAALAHYAGCSRRFGKLAPEKNGEIVTLPEAAVA